MAAREDLVVMRKEVEELRRECRAREERLKEWARGIPELCTPAGVPKDRLAERFELLVELALMEGIDANKIILEEVHVHKRLHLLRRRSDESELAELERVITHKPWLMPRITAVSSWTRRGSCDNASPRKTR
jgi:hypothetical protein